MSKYLLLTLLLLLSTHPLRASEQIGTWFYQIKGKNFEMYTANESSSLFGFICKEEQCYFYLTASDGCNDGDEIDVLVNLSNGTGISNASCYHFERKNGKIPILRMKDDFLSEGLKNSTEVGFGFAVDGGQFKVSKFSMNGFDRALVQLKQRISESPSVRGNHEDKKL